MRAIGYVRVSTEDQAQEGLSLAAQGERLGAYCQAQGWELRCVYTDPGASGKTLNRPGFQAALKALEAGEAGVLLALKLDRLTRSVVDFYTLSALCADLGVELETVEDTLDTKTADGRFFANIKAGMSQYERERIAERTKAALAFKRSRGEWMGLVPFGFRIGEGGHLEEDPAELSMIQRMKRWHRLGASYRAIARRLDAEGVKARRGRWSHVSVRRLVSEHLNARKARYCNTLKVAVGT